MTIKQRILKLLPTRIYLELKFWDYKRTKKSNFEQMQNLRRITSANGYSFKPFDDKKAIFVHIPKCAGISLNRAIFGNLAGGHRTLEEYLTVFEPKCINEYFKFTIVRNPWDRLVSAYFFLKKGGVSNENRVWFEKELSGFAGFDDFIRNWIDEENIWKCHHFRPQYHYILDKRKKVRLDFVGFFENL